jgi:glycosyltransferase involved in cell wall biosynthesis
VTAPGTPGPVLIDVQATQSASHRDRGVARYTAELAAALWRTHRPLVHSFLLNPDLPPPGAVEPLVASGRLCYSDRGDFRLGDDDGARLLHVASPFELDVPVSRLWPAAAATRGLRLVVTLYDLIPEIFAERYLADPGLRRRYRARLELVRAADAVLAISEQTARDAVERLQIPDERIVVVGAAASASYTRGESSASDARAAARAAVSGLEARFVLYTAGMDDRKNFHGLFRAWARLPEAVREEWQLVMVCSVDDPTRAHLLHLAREAGIESRLLLPGFVPDSVLQLLYQSTDLFVFPSLYEGYGLPIAEALACGARTIGSGTSAVAELLVPEARFDPSSDAGIATAIERALTDDAQRARLDEQARRPLPNWDAVGDRVADAYEQLLARPRPAARRRPLVAVVTPLPPAASGVADYSFRLLAALREHCDVHAFADGRDRVDPQLGPPRAPDGVDVLPVRRLVDQERARGGYDCVVYCLGNSEYHAGALAQLRRRSGIVLAHEVRLTDLYALATDEPGAVPDGFAACLAAMYDGLPPETGAGGRLSPDDAERLGVLMAAEVAALADRFVVMSEFAADRVRLDVRPDDADRICVVPFGMPEPVLGATPTDARAPVIASFGVVNAVKQYSLLVASLPAVLSRCPEALLAFVGPCAEADRDAIVALATTLGVAERVVVTGAVSEREYASWLDRAAVAIQLRRTANGESSAAVADGLAADAVLVVTGIGAGRDLPGSAVVAVSPTVSERELASVVSDLLADPERRIALAAAARDYAAQHSFPIVATRLFEAVIAPAIRDGLSVPRLLSSGGESR